MLITTGALLPTLVCVRFCAAMWPGVWVACLQAGLGVQPATHDTPLYPFNLQHTSVCRDSCRHAAVEYGRRAAIRPASKSCRPGEGCAGGPQGPPCKGAAAHCAAEGSFCGGDAKRCVFKGRGGGRARGL
jgi:hypothetical protein